MTAYTNYTRALTFENLCQIAHHKERGGPSFRKHIQMRNGRPVHPAVAPATLNCEELVDGAQSGEPDCF
jgi:hypothetical protein